MTKDYTAPLQLADAVRRLPLAPWSGKQPRKIGYLVNYSFHIWYQIVVATMRIRCEQYGAELMVADAELSAARQTEEAFKLLEAGVDALIVTPAGQSSSPFIDEARQRGIAVVAEANPLAGAATLVAICDYDAGVRLGVWAGKYAHDHGWSTVRLLDIALPHLRPCLLRSEGFLDGLRQIRPDAELVARVNGEARVGVAGAEAARVLKQRPDVNLIFGMDDESTAGGINAAAAVGAQITAVAFGLSGDADKDRLRIDGPLAGGVAMFPEYVAVTCVDSVVRASGGSSLASRTVAPAPPLSRAELEQYFLREDGRWIPDFSAISRLPAEAICTKQ